MHTILKNVFLGRIIGACGFVRVIIIQYFFIHLYKLG